MLAFALSTNSAGTVPFETRTLATEILVRTDADGKVVLNQQLASGTYLVSLSFPGDGQLAPLATKFIHQVT